MADIIACSGIWRICLNQKKSVSLLLALLWQKLAGIRAKVAVFVMSGFWWLFGAS